MGTVAKCDRTPNEQCNSERNTAKRIHFEVIQLQTRATSTNVFHDGQRNVADTIWRPTLKHAVREWMVDAGERMQEWALQKMTAGSWSGRCWHTGNTTGNIIWTLSALGNIGGLLDLPLSTTDRSSMNCTVAVHIYQDDDDTIILVGLLPRYITYWTSNTICWGEGRVLIICIGDSSIWCSRWCCFLFRKNDGGSVGIACFQQSCSCRCRAGVSQLDLMNAESFLSPPACCPIILELMTTSLKVFLDWFKCIQHLMVWQQSMRWQMIGVHITK